MSEFWETLNEYIGEQESIADIRAIVRRCWFYDFDGYPLRVWQGKGRLITTDGNKWLGTIDAKNVDHHKTPSIKDGRDGSSSKNTMSLKIVDTPDLPAKELYNAIKSEQWRVFGRKVICYLAIFNQNEGLRPQTPLAFFKEFVMMHTNFSEKAEIQNGAVRKIYTTSVVCKDGNFGRSEVPNGTYANAIQQERARQLGVETDYGCQYLASLANRTFIIP